MPVSQSKSCPLAAAGASLCLGDANLAKEQAKQAPRLQSCAASRRFLPCADLRPCPDPGATGHSCRVV